MGAGSQCVRIELVAKPGLYRRRVGRGQGDDVGHVAVDARGPIRLHAGGPQVWQLRNDPYEPAARPPTGFMPVDARFENF